MTAKDKIEDLSVEEAKLSAFVNLRVTEAEKARLKSDAENAGASVSEVVRRRYFNRPIVTKTDLVAINELRRQGGLLKHLFNNMLENKYDEALAKQTAETLEEVRKAIRRLGA